MAIKVYVDSDVVISSLISLHGAAYHLINTSELELIISDVSTKEQESVVERLALDKKNWRKLIKERFRSIKLRETNETIKKRYENFISDPNDAHIVAGAKQAKAKFLLTYNMKHFKIDHIKQEFGITSFTPAKFMQYLRSLE